MAQSVSGARRLIFQDAASNLFLWTEAGAVMPVPGFTGPAETCTWAQDAPGLFALSDVLQLHLYLFLADSLAGPGARAWLPSCVCSLLCGLRCRAWWQLHSHPSLDRLAGVARDARVGWRAGQG